EAISQWLKSPEARTITKEEIRALSLTDQGDLMRCLEGLQKKPVSEQYIAFIKGIVDLTKDHMLTLYENFIKDFIKSANLVTAQEKRISVIELNKQLETLRPVLRIFIEKNESVVALCTYKNIPIDDLEKYLNFLRSESGRQYLQISHEAMGYVI